MTAPTRSAPWDVAVEIIFLFSDIVKVSAPRPIQQATAIGQLFHDLPLRIGQAYVD